MEFRAAVTHVDSVLDPWDVARALVIDCIIDVDFDGNFDWSCPPLCAISESAAGHVRIIGASGAYSARLVKGSDAANIDSAFLTTGTRRKMYAYTSITSLRADITTRLAGMHISSVESWSLIRALPSVARALAAAEEIAPPDVGHAEKLIVSYDSMSFDFVPRTEYQPSAFEVSSALEPNLWRLPTRKTILVKDRRCYKVQPDVGRLSIILDRIKRIGKRLTVNWYPSLDDGELVSVLAVPRVSMPLLYRRALRVMGGTYPPFSDPNRLWITGINEHLGSEFADKLGMSFRKVE